MNSQIVTVNLVPGLSAPAVVRVSQYDYGRPILFKVLDGTMPASFVDGTVATVVGTKPSGLGFSEVAAISGNTASLNSTLAMTQEAGMIQAEVRFSIQYGPDIGTANFVLAVEKTPHAEGTTDGTQETMANLETRLQGQIDELDSRIDAIEGDQSIIDDIDALDARVTALEQGGSGISQTEKNLILTLFSKAAYAESDASTAYNTLETLWTVTTRTITYNLSHVTSSNTASSVDGGSRYTTTLTATGNYTLNSVTVTMGGVDITSTAYSSGTITIPSVTGNIVITATAVLAAQSITATYTQSGTVYDTDTLDSLKSDLVVTANYSGGTSETITGYTLSGTLIEGTSTITVEYAGLTDTFSVVVSSATKLFNLASLTSTIDGSEEVDTNLNLREYENVSIMLTIDTLSAFNWNSQVLFSDGGTTASCLQLKINGNGNVDFMLSGMSKTLNPTIIGVMSSTGQKQAPLVFTFEGMNTNTPYITAYGYINNEVVATERWSKNITSAPNIGTKLYFAPDKAHSYNIAQRFQGTLTDIRVLGKIVSAAEIAAYCEGE